MTHAEIIMELETQDAYMKLIQETPTEYQFVTVIGKLAVVKGVGIRITDSNNPITPEIATLLFELCFNQW